MEETIFRMVIKSSAQLFEAYNMSVEPAPAYFVSTRFGNKCFFKTCQQRTRQHHRSAKAPAFFAVRFTAQVIHIHIICLEDTGMPVFSFYFHLHLLQQFDQQVHVKDIRYIADGHFFRRQQYCADDLQRFIFGALGSNFSL